MLDLIDGRRCPSMFALQVDVSTDVIEGRNVLQSLKQRPQNAFASAQACMHA